MRRPNPNSAAIVQAYVKGIYTTQQIARAYGLSRSQVQRIVKAHGMVRTMAEANIVAGPLKARSRIRVKD
jgi:transposase-like protein